MSLIKPKKPKTTPLETPVPLSSASLPAKQDISGQEEEETNLLGGLVDYSDED
jgi:hypothetical protein